MTRAERIITALEARIVELERHRDVLINGQVDASSGWLRAIDTALVVSHLGIAEPGDTHKQASTKLAALIDWHVAVATDPAVNGGLQLARAIQDAGPPDCEGGHAQKSFWAGFETARMDPSHSNIRTAWNEFKSSEQFARIARGEQ